MLTAVRQMVHWLAAVPFVVGIPDGTLPICNAPHLRTTAAIYCHIPWRHRPDHIFCSWGEFLLTAGRPKLTNVSVAFHTPHIVIVDHPAGCTGMVSCQLLPTRKHWLEIRRPSRRWKSSSLDERLSRSIACTDKPTHLVPIHSLDSATYSIRVVSTTCSYTI